MGASWVTTLVGGVVIMLTWANQIFVDQGIPKDGKEWMAFLMGNVTGLIGVFAKAWNVSNASQPTAATVVSAADEAKPNPSAPVAPVS